MGFGQALSTFTQPQLAIGIIPDQSVIVKSNRSANAARPAAPAKASSIMNDFERLRRCSALDSLPSYPWGDRSMSMAVSHAMRSDPRSCPTRQTRNVPAADSDPESSNGQPRRRIAVACARCRKRKIRCSGDPGNGSGCQNCRAAGADISACQFHRVGSYVPTSNIYNCPNPLSASTALSMSNLYHGQAGDYYAPHPKSLLPPRAYPSYSTVGYENEPPAESYAYQPLQVPGNDMLTAGFISSVQEPMRSWSTMGQKQQTSNAIYLDEPSTASYSNLQLPYLSATPVTRQQTLAADNMSAFSMNSLQSSLASPPPPPHPPLPSSLEDRHLPVPTATRVQMTPSSALHLRAQQASIASASNALSYTKPSATTWNPDSTVQENRRSTPNILPSGLPSSLSHGQLMSASSGKQPVTVSLQESAVIGYIPVANSSPDNSSNPSTSTVYTPSSLSGATPSSLSLNEKYATTGLNVVQPTSSTRDDAIPRSDSTTSFSYYATESSSGKRNSSTEHSSQENTLINGQRYTPLQPHPPHTSAGLEQLRRDSFDDHRNGPTHRASVSSLSDHRY
ncbi:Glycoside hydrolase family 10 [Lasiodiplodia theobromae]|uniref:Glycoside hydrolase family 10 n=1 Tax=Lasiodiplodia theobromae TaxID=45133 RepID=UPI0015C302E4|nr:Glycoside hydrolase family 10 [Lasiodiplodia theobromae]KAF4542413.1 Glycoside hydrolase family 10 [Lasiodiplodia theobromae]